MSNGLTASTRARYSDHALTAYLAPLLQGRRVAVIGPTSGELARRARALGAQSTLSFGGQGDGIAVRPLTPGSLRGFRGRLDVVIVPDAGLVPLRGVLEEARHALGQDGVLVVASVGAADRRLEAQSSERVRGPEYHALYDALARDFALVRMVGRGSFVAYALAALDGGDRDGVALDTRLMPDDPEAAEGFIAVASDRPFALDAMALVQVPTGEVLESAAPAVPARDPALLDERDRARSEASRSAAELLQLRAALAGAEALRDDLRNELAARDARVKDLEANAAERWVQLQRLEHQYKELEEDARKARDRAVRLSKDLEDERKLRQRVEIEAQMQTRRGGELPVRASDGAELARARERVEQLEREISAFRAKVDGLVRELDETQATEGELRSQLDDAMRRARDATARRERAEEQLKNSSEHLSAANERVKTAESRAAVLEAREAELVARLASAPAIDPSELSYAREEYARLESALRDRAVEVNALNVKLAERDAAVRELAFALEQAESGAASIERQTLRDRVSSLAGLNASLTTEARQVLEQNTRLRDELARVTDELARANERAEAPTARADAASEAGPVTAPAGEPLAQAEPDAALHEAEAARAAAEFALERAQKEIDALRAAAVARGAEVDASQLEALRASNAEIARERDRARAASAELSREASSAREREASALAKLLESESAAAQARARADRAEAALAQANKTTVVDPAVLRERDEAVRALEAERARVVEVTRQLSEARAELSRQFALAASTDDRVQQALLELEGTRAGFKRRVRELEREVEQLVQALEIATTESKDEMESFDRFLRDIDLLRAEKAGVELRLRDAEASIASVRAAAERRAERSDTVPPSANDASDPLGIPVAGSPGLRTEQLLADLAETAARLASTEEALSQARDLATEAETRAELARRDLEAVRAELARTPAVGQVETIETMRREAVEREVLARSLVAQLEDRDLRLRSMERRLVEEVERARRTESEIWELELRSRDQRIAQLSRELDRARTDEPRVEVPAGLRAELDALRAGLSAREAEVGRLRSSVELVRSGLSSILVDGRGAVVAHDLVTILRQIEDPAAAG